MGDTNMYFLRHGTDHHSMVLCNGAIYNAAGRGGDIPADVTVNQMTWQVASLARSRARSTGSTPRCAHQPRRPRHARVELALLPVRHRGAPQRALLRHGADRLDRPVQAQAMHERGYRERPPLPQIPEYEEVKQSAAKGVDFNSGFRHPETMPAKYDVDGIMLPRPSRSCATARSAFSAAT